MISKQASLKIDRRLYKKYCSNYERLYKHSDDFLYSLCENCRDHRNLGETYTKVQLIGLAYRADPGRHGKPIKDVAEFLTLKHSEVDRIFNRLRKVSESNSSLNALVLQKVVEEHGSLLELLCKKFTKGRIPRSFLSKYMHFHFPNIVPIFDSIADRKIRSFCYESGELSKPLGADEKYYKFCNRFLTLWNYAVDQRLNPNPTVKSLDQYLYSGGKKS